MSGSFSFGWRRWGLLLGLLTTSSFAAEPPPAVRVQPRLLQKEDRLFLTAGLGHLARGDYYDNLAVQAAVGYYPGPRDAVELQLGYFFSGLNAAAAEVFSRTGLVPDAHRPVGFAALGWRRSLGYGKVLLEQSTRVVHFDLQGAAHLGVSFTDRGAAPLALFGPALLVRAGERFVFKLDLAGNASVEQRRQLTFVPGLMLTLGAGVSL